MRITVTELADMWRGAARSMRGYDQAPAFGEPDEREIARAQQLEACADDLVNTKFHHELVEDPASHQWWKKLL